MGKTYYPNDDACTLWKCYGSMSAPPSTREAASRIELTGDERDWVSADDEQVSHIYDTGDVASVAHQVEIDVSGQDANVLDLRLRGYGLLQKYQDPNWLFVENDWKLYIWNYVTEEYDYLTGHSGGTPAYLDKRISTGASDYVSDANIITVLVQPPIHVGPPVHRSHSYLYYFAMSVDIYVEEGACVFEFSGTSSAGTGQTWEEHGASDVVLEFFDKATETYDGFHEHVVDPDYSWWGYEGVDTGDPNFALSDVVLAQRKDSAAIRRSGRATRLFMDFFVPMRYPWARVSEIAVDVNAQVLQGPSPIDVTVSARTTAPSENFDVIGMKRLPPGYPEVTECVFTSLAMCPSNPDYPGYCFFGDGASEANFDHGTIAGSYDTPFMWIRVEAASRQEHRMLQGTYYIYFDGLGGDLTFANGWNAVSLYSAYQSPAFWIWQSATGGYVKLSPLGLHGGKVGWAVAVWKGSFCDMVFKKGGGWSYPEGDYAFDARNSDGEGCGDSDTRKICQRATCVVSAGEDGVPMHRALSPDLSEIPPGEPFPALLAVAYLAVRVKLHSFLEHPLDVFEVVGTCRELPSNVHGDVTVEMTGTGFDHMAGVWTEHGAPELVFEGAEEEWETTLESGVGEVSFGAVVTDTKHAGLTLPPLWDQVLREAL